MPPQIQNPLIPQGSLVLVTAANGLIASHIVDQLLHYGYRVRGTVRSHSRCSWMAPLYASRHPGSSLEIVEIADINAPGCYDAALKGVSAVIHTASNTSMSIDPEIIETTVKANLNALEAVAAANKNGEKIKKVVLTTSSWAVCYPRPNMPMDLTQDTYDTYAEEMLANPDLSQLLKGLMTYTVSKKRSEQESWKWWKEHKDCGFTFNTVIPSTCIGPVLDPEAQPYPSTAGFVRSLYDGKNAELFEFLEPQWCVDVRDAARLHVAGAVLEGVEGERIYGFAETFTWPRIAAVLEDEMGKKVPIALKDKGEDLTQPPKERSAGLLKRLGLTGWVPFETAVRDNIRSYYPKI